MPHPAQLIGNHFSLAQSSNCGMNWSMSVHCKKAKSNGDTATAASPFGHDDENRRRTGNRTQHGLSKMSSCRPSCCRRNVKCQLVANPSIQQPADCNALADCARRSGVALFVVQYKSRRHDMSKKIQPHL